MSGAPPEVGTEVPGLSRRLRRMRTFATALLVLMGVIYVGTTWFASPSPYLEALRAFAEAALVGGLADWFAVTALFRRPLDTELPEHPLHHISTHGYYSLRKSRTSAAKRRGCSLCTQRNISAGASSSTALSGGTTGSDAASGTGTVAGGQSSSRDLSMTLTSPTERARRR